MIKLRPLDFVRTPGGGIALVSEVNPSGDASITYLGGGNPSHEKNAWWYPHEGLVVLDSLPRLLAGMMHHPFGLNRDRGDRWFPLLKDDGQAPPTAFPDYDSEKP
jgi:hypothetical protein